MKKKILWAIVIVLTVINVVLHYAYFNIVQTDFIISEIYEFVFTISFPVAIGLATGAILALIPFKKLSYKSKLSYVFPTITMLIAGLYTYSTATLAYYKEAHGKEIGPITYFREVEVPEETNCNEVREGIFETDNLIIERSGNLQIQTNKETGEKTSFKINWTSNCEYLLETDDPEKDLKGKIVKVDSEGYDCFVAKGINAQKNRIRRKTPGNTRQPSP